MSRLIGGNRKETNETLSRLRKDAHTITSNGKYSEPEYELSVQNGEMNTKYEVIKLLVLCCRQYKLTELSLYSFRCLTTVPISEPWINGTRTMSGENVDPESQPGSQPQGLPPNHEAPATKSENAGRDVPNDAVLEVFWDDPADQDPANPMNWSARRKWSIVAMVSFITFLT